MRVAAIQAESVWLDMEKGVDKVCTLIAEAAAQNCDLVGFPEVFVPGFCHTLFITPPDPIWMLKYQKNSIVVGSPLYNRVLQCAKDNDIAVVFGFSERDGSALYLSQSFISRNGELLSHRRKIKPTSVERYLWADGGSDSINNVVVDEKTGARIGGLNCWEHMQPLLRYNQYEQGKQIHVASWPYMPYSGPWFTQADACGGVMSNMNAIEGHAFVMVCTAVMNDEGNGNEIMRMTAKDLGRTPLGVVAHGGGFAAIYGPDGNMIARAKDQFCEQLVIADIDLAETEKARLAQAKFGDSSLPDNLITLNATKTEAPRIAYSDDRHLKNLTQRFRELAPHHNRVRSMV